MREVPPKGPASSPIVFVGEAPGSEEVKAGQPFVGPSGRVFQEALSATGTTIEPYITNVVKHKIGTGIKPDAMQRLIGEVHETFIAEIKAHPHRLIVAMGNAAMWALTGDYSLKITKRRGQILPSPLAELGILCTTHPAYLLRGNGSFRQFKADVMYAMQIAGGAPPNPWAPPTIVTLKTAQDVENLYQQLLQLPHESVVSGDLETRGFSFLMHSILSGGITFDGKTVYTFWGTKSDVPPEWNLLGHIDKLFTVPHLRYNWHNGKFDIKFLRNLGTAARVDDDTMLMSYALDEQRGLHDLETVAGDWLRSPNWKGTLDAYKKANQSYDVIPADVLERYMAYDIANTHNLVAVMRPQIDRDKASSRLYYKTLIPASDYLADIETRGLLIDKARVGQNYDKLMAQIQPIKEELLVIATERANANGTPSRYTDKLCNSPKQLSDLLFDDFKIPLPKGIERSTADDVLEKLPQDWPVINALRRYRVLHKGFSTYVKPYYMPYEEGGNVQSDGRVHCTYLIHGTATGRLSSRDPNLQNIPRDPELRGMFIAPEGRGYVEPDLNQAELRSLAALSGDPALCAIYEAVGGKGLHEEVRASLYGHPSDWSERDVEYYLNKWHLTPETRYNPETREDRILEEQKMRSKNVNFGIVYGITAAGLSEQIDDTPQEAQRLLDGWAAKFPQAWKFIQMCRQAPLRNQNLVTVFGHRKRIGIISANNLTNVQNECANFPHQSVASTITMHAGIRTYKRISAEYDAYFVNTVHDSLLIETPLDPVIMNEVAELVMAELTQVPRDWGITRIPFKADAKFGTRWGALGKQSKFYERMGWEMPKAA